MRRDFFFQLISILVCSLPTLAAKPTVTFSASPAAIVRGSSSTLSWVVSGAASISINNGIGAVGASGSRAVVPSSTTTYTLTARNSSGTTSRKVTVTVTVPPPTVAISASPQQVEAGHPSVLAWVSTDATSVEIDNGVGVVDASGSLAVNVAETTCFTIQAGGPGGTASASVTVTVVLPPPAISLVVEPNPVAPGEPAVLSWQATHADAVQIDNGIGGVASSGSCRVTPSSTTTYSATATGNGQTATAAVTVTVDSSLLPGPALFARPRIAKAGNSARLSWIAGHSAWAEMDNGIGRVDPGGGAVAVTPAATCGYGLLAGNEAGTRRAEAAVTVRPAPLVYAFIPCNTSHTLAVINTATRQVVKSIAVGSAPQCAVAASDGTRVYVLRSGGVDVLDTGRLAVTGSIGVAGAGLCMAVHPDGRRLYVECEEGAVGSKVYSIAKVDTELGAETGRVTLGGDGKGLTVHPAGAFLYSVQWTPGRLLVLDPGTLEILRSVPLVTSYPKDLVSSPDGRRLYVINDDYTHTGSWLQVIDTIGFSTAATLQLKAPSGSWDTFNGVAISPDGARVFLSRAGYRITSIDAGSCAVLATATLSGALLNDMAFLPDGAGLYVVSTGMVRVLNPLTLALLGDIGSLPGARGYGGSFISARADPVSGKVTRSNSGAGGVTLTARGTPTGGDGEIVRTALTDSTGAYTLALPDGTFTLRPSLGADYFSPGQRRVEVHGSLGSLDFLVSSTPFPPTVSLSADPAAIDAGQISTLAWETDNATSASLDNGIGPIPLSGSMTVTPAMTTTYTLCATGEGGTASAQAKVSIYFPPPTALFSASPGTILRGESSTLSWSTTGAETVTIDPGIGAVDPAGARAVQPGETTTYTLRATGAGGTITSTVTVEVREPPPRISHFTATPEAIPPGGSAILSWQVTGADTVTIDHGIGPVPASGSAPIAPAEETVYTLTASGPGGTATTQVTVRMLDQVLRGVWEGMRGALLSGDIDHAVSHFADDSQSSYRELFSFLSTQLGEISQEIAGIEYLGLLNGMAIYRVKKMEVIDGAEVEISYRIHFANLDGEWKIWEF